MLALRSKPTVYVQNINDYYIGKVLLDPIFMILNCDLFNHFG